MSRFSLPWCGGLVFLGKYPHCVLEVREQGDGRLIRIVELMRRCRISIHDLSRTGTPVRFNMPLELGLACALKLEQPKAYEVVVMDAIPYRIDRALSDYKGRDPLVHTSTAGGMIGCLLDTFETDVKEATKKFMGAARHLRRTARVLKAERKADSIFRPALFRLLVDSATELAIEQGFIRA
jgi:hypothetical protein